MCTKKFCHTDPSATKRASLGWCLGKIYKTACLARKNGQAPSVARSHGLFVFVGARRQQAVAREFSKQTPNAVRHWGFAWLEAAQWCGSGVGIDDGVLRPIATAEQHVYGFGFVQLG